jgi:hypothetical protein
LALPPEAQKEMFIVDVVSVYCNFRNGPVLSKPWSRQPLPTLRAVQAAFSHLQIQIAENNGKFCSTKCYHKALRLFSEALASDRVELILVTRHRRQRALW